MSGTSREYFIGQTFDDSKLPRLGFRNEIKVKRSSTKVSEFSLRQPGIVYIVDFLCRVTVR